MAKAISREDLDGREAKHHLLDLLERGNRCWERKIRKVLHVGDQCCANCVGAYAPTGMNLMELCPYGAISVVDGGFQADPRLCRGCYNCYDNIICYFNNTRDFSERVLRMVAHIGPKDF
jgi:heterodisulfide reductase subunit A-like polyferredoxin